MNKCMKKKTPKRGKAQRKEGKKEDNCESISKNK
jgi:hypothetical protein